MGRDGWWSCGVRDQVSKLPGGEAGGVQGGHGELKAQQAAVFGKYGLTAPAGRDGGGMAGGGRAGVRDQVSKLPAERQAAFKAEMEKLKAQRAAVLSKYGLTPPAGRDTA
jgi:hypothetical protein